MGYYTTFTGDIYYTNPKVALLLEKLIIDDEAIKDIENWEVDTKEKIIMFNGVEIKNYRFFMERLCMAIAFFDKTAFGLLYGSGEEKSDFFAIEVKEGKIIRLQGEVQYKEDTDFQEEAKEQMESIKVDVAKLTQRKDLLKEVAIKEL